MADFVGDVRYVLRGWRRAPGASATMLATLTLGLGLAAGIFSFADGYLFRPLPFPAAERVYFVRDPNGFASALLASDVSELRRSSVADLGFVEWETGYGVNWSLRVGDRHVDLAAAAVSPGFREILQLPLLAGRDFIIDDHRETGRVSGWLAYRFWQREFGGDPDVLGRTFRLRTAQGSTAFHVVGILGPEVTSFDLNNRPPDVVVPRVEETDVGPSQLAFPIVRLPEGVNREQGEARIAAVLQAVAPATDGRPRAARLRPLREVQVAGGKPTARVLFAGALLVLLLAAINLVHLLMTRGVARAAEIATRAALGASPWRIARLFLVESLLVGAIGIAGGLLVGSWLAALIRSHVPGYPTSGRNLALVPMAFDGRVVAFATLLGVIVALAGACWPAWRALRRPLARIDRSAFGVTSSLPARLSGSILASELAVATVLMLGTLFIGLGIWRYLHQPLGFDLVDRYLVKVAVADPSGPTSVELDLARDAIRNVAGVRDAGSFTLNQIRDVEIPGRSADEEALRASSVSPGYFETWNVRLLAGRWFEPAEFDDEVPLAIVDGKLASLVWPTDTPLGKDIRVGGLLRRVIGVVEHRRLRLNRETAGQVYVPSAHPPDRVSLVAWLQQSSAVDARQRLGGAIRTVLPGAEVRIEPVTLETLFLRDVGEARFQAPIMAAFGVLAFVLAGIGVFGVVSFVVERRTREFGIRLALGAGPADLWRSVVRQSVVPACGGLAIGLGGAFALESLVRASVFGWESSGVGASSVVTLALFAVALAGAAAPARRAMRVDPSVTLRME